MANTQLERGVKEFQVLSHPQLTAGRTHSESLLPDLWQVALSESTVGSYFPKAEHMQLDGRPGCRRAGQ